MNIGVYIKFFVLSIFVCFICIGLLLTPTVESQFSGFNLTPPYTDIGYGGLFNPNVFWPGLGLKSAASSIPLVPFLPFSYGNFGLGNLLGSLPQWGYSSFNPSMGLSGFGLNNPFGTFSLFGYNFLNPFSFAPLSANSSGVPITFGPILPSRSARQTGTWSGTWTSTYIAFQAIFNTGPMVLNITEDPLLGTLIGTGILQGSRYASALFDVAGTIVNNVIILEGFLGTGYDIVLTCVLTSPTTITGFYTVLGTAIPIMDEGVFDLILSPAVI